MKVLYGLDQLPESQAVPSAIAIGNFDGMHLGHHKVLKFLNRIADKNKILSIVLTFHPHPKSILGRKPLSLIQTLDQRLEEMAKHKLHTALILPFDRKMAEIKAGSFIQDILLKQLRAKAIIVGENFFFGKNREGSVAYLKQMAERHGFKVYSCSSAESAGVGISSSTIRSLLFSGRIEEAGKMLGRFYSIDGSIVGGRSKGRTLGFPTANIQTTNEILPPGVYITRAKVEGHRLHLPSITNIGECPTFGRTNRTSVESYLIDFQGNIYGRGIRLHFLKKLREEARFPSPESLTNQLKMDLDQARCFFEKNPLSQRD